MIVYNMITGKATLPLKKFLITPLKEIKVPKLQLNHFTSQNTVGQDLSKKFFLFKLFKTFKNPIQNAAHLLALRKGAQMFVSPTVSK
jgi:hypothetical protein